MSATIHLIYEVCVTATVLAGGAAKLYPHLPAVARWASWLAGAVRRVK